VAALPEPDAPEPVTLLRRRADGIVRDVLARNEGRWESTADAERAHALARTIAERVLHGPIAFLHQALDGDELRTAEELLGLS
jgi:Glutamyl-tRNAGlu reductase, dimerisation domain